MRLKKLELYGFKSFASRTEIVFGDGITGIVGPNGSGKSNIGDAVRWVLGEQSAKTLRGSSMSDVIFNGTQTRKPLSYCEVSLIFDNEDRTLPMDFSEIMVTRRVYRNGESEYFLNQSSCRLKDVIDLFRDTGIGKEGYSIIGQGRIDEILSRKSEDRRQVFEEAAGIVKFKARKEEADRKLERTLQNAERIDDILDELGKRLEPLEQQSRSARQYLEWSEELKTLDLNLFLLRSDRYEKRLNELRENINNITDVVQTTQKHIDDQIQSRDQVASEIDMVSQTVHATREELTHITENLHQTEQSIHILRTRLDTRKEHRNQLLLEINQNKEKIRNLEELHSLNAKQADQKEKELLDAQNKLQLLEKQEHAAEEDHDQCAQKLEEKQHLMIEVMNQTSSSMNDQTRLLTMQTQMEERMQSIQDSLSGLQIQEKELTQIYETSQELLSEENQKLQNIKSILDADQKKLESVDQQIYLLRTQAEKKSSEMQGLQSRYHLLNEMSSEMEGYFQSVRHAVQYAKENHLTGVHGVLATLIHVPEQFETAIDMALGNAIQNIVTDQEETAKTIIDYLRSHKLGRATFLPISAIKGKTLNSNERSVLSMPGCIGIASELISYQTRYQPIIENLLGRTVIADNLEHGIAIMRAGHHAFRLVTLTGDVMHSGGSMTGGSVQSKMTNLLGREREIKQLAEQLKKGKTEFDVMKQSLEEMQNQKREVSAKIEKTIDDLHQQEIAIAREQDHAMHANENLSNNHQSILDTQEALEQLQLSISDIQSQLQNAQHNSQTNNVSQETIEEEIRQLQFELNEKRTYVNQLSDAFMQSKLSISDLQHDIDIMHKDDDHYQKESNQILLENKQKNDTIERLQQNDTEDNQQIASLSSQLQTIQFSRDAQQQTVAHHEKQLTDLQGQLNEIVKNVENLHTALSRDSDNLHKLELSQSKTESDLKTLQERIWSTYELTYGGAEAFRQAEGFSESAAEKRCRELNAQIRSLGNINVGAIEEYVSTKERFDDLTTQQNDLKKAEEDIRNLIAELIQQMEKTFVQNFTLLQHYFRETFVRLFGGGHAEIELTDPDDPLNCGIEVNVQPPGKKLQLLSLLSGGERALTAIAILFAMLKLKPTPFCILDEIEAALDDANIGYYADYLKEYSSETQFIVVTHRKGTMERCNSLFGVSMEEQGVSRMVSVSLQDYKDA
ncbi:MAG: chromosome segregation protein SMC [Clostridia bacterium]|nr:chromosome segregation protein SMC [Clostridia bacterium]